MSYPFLTIFLASIFLAAVYVTLRREQLLFMAMVLVSLGVVSSALAYVSRRWLAVHRTVFDRVQDGGTVHVTLELENRGTLPRFGVTLLDECAPWLERQGQPVRFIPVLWPRRRVTVEYDLRATRRGCHPVGPTRVRLGDPLGMFQRIMRAGEASEALVYPEVVTLPAPLTGQTPFAPGLSEQRSALGAGTDFYGIREYQPGDELRRIHWKATARRGRLAVVEFEENLTGNLIVLLDAETGNDRGTGTDTTFEVAVKVAAALLHDGLSQGTTVRLVAHAARGRVDVEAGALEEEDGLLEALARVEADGQTPVTSIAADLASQVGAGETVAIVTAKPNEALVDAALTLHQVGLPPVVVLVDPAGFDPQAARAAAPVVADALNQAGTRAFFIPRGEPVAQALTAIRDGYDRGL